MSSPSSQSENAAHAVPVSSSAHHPAAAPAAPAAAAADATGAGAGAGGSLPEQEVPHPDAALQPVVADEVPVAGAGAGAGPGADSGADPAVQQSGQRAAPPQSTGQAGPPPPHPPTTAPVVDQNKKSRGAPAVLQRSPGPSLLTQALASARGIPSSSLGESSHSPHKHSARQPHDPASPDGPRPPEPSNPPGQQTPSDTHHDAHPQHASLPLRGSSRPTAMGSAATLPPPAVEALPPAAYDILDLSTVNSMLRGHREYLSKSSGRGTSLERTERERRVQGLADVPTRPDTSLAQPIPTTASQPELAPGHDRADTEAKAGTDGRRQRPQGNGEQRVSMGPEKIWSIGSADSETVQDGQVEKAVAEVLAGVEPNARSRKASHSLRFFKEGLPEEKVKRRESRLAPVARDKLPAIADTAADADKSADVGAEHSTTAHATNEGPVPGHFARVRSFPLQSRDAGHVPQPTHDYFDIVHAKEKAAGPGAPHAEAAPEGRMPETTHMPRQTPPATSEPESADHSEPEAPREAGEIIEDGEDSGEEKISSAVFLPHQGLEDSAEIPQRVEDELPRPGIGPRTVSREGPHSWLVKADEPEADDVAEAEDKHGMDRPDRPHAVETEPPRPKHTEPTPRVEREPTDAQLSTTPRPVPQHYHEHIHNHQLAAPKQPLEAIELIPYKHQVGGHTTLWRFSKRAVCKQLNNRENEFYERIERYHRDLLAFLPRYIGVLNVTFHKQPRRRSTVRKDDGAAQERKRIDQDELRKAVQGSGTSVRGETSQELAAAAKEQPRVISQSLHSSQIPVPTVTFVDNQHILPRNLLQPNASPTGSPGRFRSISASSTSPRKSPPMSGEEPPSIAQHIRPSLEERHANSWGATLVNKKLRNEVFNDAFLKQSIPIHRHKKAHQKHLPRQTLQRLLRPANSDPNLMMAPGREPSQDGPLQPKLHVPSLRHSESQGDIGTACRASESDDESPKDVTGTSAPEPEIFPERASPHRKKRRYSGSALRRKPKDVSTPRGNLKYWEEPDVAAYKDDNDDNDDALAQDSPHVGEAQNGHAEGPAVFPMGPGDDSALTSGVSSPSEFRRIPRPVNPKEAQTQRDSRVEYFLLLEDLTAGMKRPCIMDLKMGTRQYGVDANPKKQKSQQRKCAGTTSHDLGVRVCGLQVWDAKTQSYIFKDKYFGRSLKAGDEFQEALTRFLYDGADQSSILRHIPTVLQKLGQLEIIIRRLRGYRFYAASLLMFYDGDQSGQDYDTAMEDSTTDFATDAEDVREGRRPRKNKREIDFKMADFANSVTAGDLAKDKPCPPQHPDEPDRGFLRGLRTLRKYFLKIQQDTRDEMGLVCQQRCLPGEVGPDIADDDDEGSVSE